MLMTQDKIKKYGLQMEEKDVAIKQLKSRLLRSEEDHFKTLEEVRVFLSFFERGKRGEPCSPQ